MIHAVNIKCALIGSCTLNRLNTVYTVLTKKKHIQEQVSPGRVAQSVTCLTADPGVTSSIPAWSHTFVEIDHEIISMVILFPSSDLFKKGCCQLQAKVCAGSTG